MDHRGSMPPQQPRRNSLRLPEFDYACADDIYFVTLRAHAGVRFSAFAGLMADIRDALLWRREHDRMRLYAYCVMPNHLHAAVSPVLGRDSVSKLMQGFKSHTTRLAWRYGLVGALWQRSYYDHILRREEDFAAICRYILDNPVRKGLVGEPSEWPYSGLVDELPG